MADLAARTAAPPFLPASASAAIKAYDEVLGAGKTMPLYERTVPVRWTTMRSSGDDLRKAALAWAAQGFRVFPLQPKGKTPLGQLVPHGCKEATTDQATIKAWWETCPSANIGIATGGGLFILDADGDDGEESLAAPTAKQGLLPETLTVKTGRGLLFQIRSVSSKQCGSKRTGLGHSRRWRVRGREPERPS